MTEYNYTKNVYTPQLLEEIATAGVGDPAYVNTDGDNISIFYSEDLSDENKSVLDQVVNDHTADVTHIPVSSQRQIDTLISYLNNADPKKQATVRAQVVLAFAPKLPIDLITQINAKTKAIVGDP